MHMLVRLSVVRMLVVRTESAPLIHLSLKFFHPITQSLYLVHTQHFSFITSFTPPSIPVSQSSHVTVWHSLSYCLTHFRCVSCFIFLHLAGCSLADAARLLFMIGYHNGHLHLLAVEPRANCAPRFCVALQLRVCARAHLLFGQFGRTYRFFFGQVPQMLGKCPMSDYNFIHCLCEAITPWIRCPLLLLA